MNNAFNNTIDRFSNEVIYDFKIRDVLTALTQKTIITNLNFERYRHKKKTFDVISFAMTKTKIFYNFRHTSLLLKFDDKTFLRLHHEYTISSKSKTKLFNQKAKPFLIKRRVERLIYELKLLDH